MTYQIPEDLKITDGKTSHKFYEAVAYSTPNALNGWTCPENIIANIDKPPYAGLSFPDGVVLTKFSFKNKGHWEAKQSQCIEWIDMWMIPQGLDLIEINFNPKMEVWDRCLNDHMVDEYYVSRTKWNIYQKEGVLT